MSENPRYRVGPAAEAPPTPRRGRVYRPGVTAKVAGELAAETVGTYLLVFVGTGALLATRQLAGGPLVSTDAALAFGLAVLVAVYALGYISGAHINPAVTIGLAVVRRFPWSAVPGYVVAQFVGALLAALTTWVLFGSRARSDLLLGATVPGPRGALVALLAEFVITFLLLVTIMAVAVDKRSPGPLVAGLAIGFVIAAGLFATLPVSGGSFNPARTLGPMIIAGQFPGWWVYVVGPIAGGIAGAATWEYLLSRGSPPAVARERERERERARERERERR